MTAHGSKVPARQPAKVPGKLPAKSPAPAGRSRARAWLTALAVGGALAACDSPRDDRFVLLRREPHPGGGPT